MLYGVAGVPVVHHPRQHNAPEALSGILGAAGEGPGRHIDDALGTQKPDPGLDGEDRSVLRMRA